MAATVAPAQDGSALVRISLVDNCRGDVKAGYDVPWHVFADMLARVEAGPKDGPAIVPADIPMGPRKAERVSHVTVLTYDVEAECETETQGDGDEKRTIKRAVGPEPPSFEDMRAELDLRGLDAVLHTTFSHHDPDIMPAGVKHSRYRVVLRLSRPILKTELKPLATHVAQLLGVSDCIDRQCLEPARLYYRPRCPADRLGDFRHAVINGEPLDVNALLGDVLRVQHATEAAKNERKGGASGSVIAEFNAAHEIGAILEAHGYERRGRERWVAPCSTTGLAGVRLLPDSTPPRVYSSHARDPLADGRAHDAFDCSRILDHGGDMAAAVRAAADQLGRESTQAAVLEFPHANSASAPMLAKTRDWRKSVEELTVTEQQVQRIENARPIWLALLYHQQYHVWVGPPNGGKTSIANYAAESLVAAGFFVIYINLDAGAADLKHYESKARQGGFTLVAPLKEGARDEDVIEIIDAMVDDGDLTNVVLILDTLKKFVDVIAKRAAKDFYKKLRALTRRGCTIIALSHTNKYKSETGELIEEGTGDLTADADNVMFLYPLKDEATGNLTVSTKFKKERAPVKDATFQLNRASRTVSVELGYFDTQAEATARTSEAEDRTLIEFIKGRIENGPANQTELVAMAKAQLGAGRRTVERVLHQYRGRHWHEDRAGECNARRYFAA